MPPSGLLIRGRGRCFRHVGEIGLNSPVIASGMHPAYLCAAEIAGLYFSARTASFLLQTWRRHSPAQTMLSRISTGRCMHACAADTPPSLLFSTARAHSHIAARSVRLTRPRQQRWSAPLELSRCRRARLGALPLSVGSGPPSPARSPAMAPARPMHEDCRLQLFPSPRSTIQISYPVIYSTVTGCCICLGVDKV